MNRTHPSAWGLALCIAALPFALAQAGADPATTPAVQHGPAGTEYLNGGSGEEERAAMATRRSPFKVVMSGAGGQFVASPGEPNDALSCLPGRFEVVLPRRQLEHHDGAGIANRQQLTLWRRHAQLVRNGSREPRRPTSP